MIQFQSWPKIARLNRDMVITEKIDGTNAAIGITTLFSTEEYLEARHDENYISIIGPDRDGLHVGIYAQSRKKIITPEKDNYGFARWVKNNAEALVGTLGEGLHFGEWWGSGVERGYGLEKGEKRFSLFNTPRYGDPEKFDLTPLSDIGVGTVPVLYYGAFSEIAIKRSLERLVEEGSKAAPGFMRPEGIIVFHVAAQMPFKVTIEGDEKPKGSTE